MLNRWIGIACTACMLSANAALLSHDLLPYWLAAAPPVSHALTLAPGATFALQVGIYNESGERIGVSSTFAGETGGRIRVRSRTILRPLMPLEGATAPDIHVRTTFSYNLAGVLDELEMKVYGIGLPISLRGEHYEGGDFGCEWQIGDETGRFVLPIRATRALGEAIRPFDSLPDLFVGRTWRLELFNPLSYFLTGGRDRGIDAESVLVQVTREEDLEHDGEVVPTHVVEARRLKAWVAPGGRVVRQEVELPLLGRIVLLDEPFDENLWRNPSTTGPQRGRGVRRGDR